MEPTGIVMFSTIGRSTYGFDVFSVSTSNYTVSSETRVTDGASVNFNAQFLEDNESVVFVSERIGSPRIYLTSPNHAKPEPLPCIPSSLFHDRPVVRNNTLYFISAHEDPGRLFRSWPALYSCSLNKEESGSNPTRLTPPEAVDYSPSVSPSGKLVAVASNGTRPWDGEFHELHTEIVVFEASKPERRRVISQRGGWPTWASDSTIFFHRQADDGWWSVYRVDFEFPLDEAKAPVRVTPSGVHCFTPAAFSCGEMIAVATRRRGKSYRHIEIFNLRTASFIPVTEPLNPTFHHYNPFVSPDSSSLGYHRFRGGSAGPGKPELIIPHLEPIASPEKNLRLLRINGSFPAFSPRGDLVAHNPISFAMGGRLMVVRSNGTKRWTLLTGGTIFGNSWSPKEDGVVYTTMGPIFQSAKATVQIARVTFDPLHLTEDREEVTCDVKILTREDSGNNAFPSCSPDGKFLVFRSGRSGYKNLYVLDAVNGEVNGGESVRQLTEGPWTDTMPSWSPKGDLIAFSSNRTDPTNPSAFSIYLVRPDGSDLRRVDVAGQGDVDRERLLHVCFSWDGEWLLFAANLGGVTSEPVSWPNQFQPYGDLYAARLDGSGLRRLTCNGYENGTPAWHGGDAVLDLGRLRLGDAGGEDELTGQFDEPLWISCDI